MEKTAELTRCWVVRIRRDDAEAVARLRMKVGVEAAFSGDDVWLRGEGEGVLKDLADQPVLQVFETEDHVLLHPPGERIPTDRLPSGLVWRSLAEVSQPVGLQTSLPSVVNQKLTLKLVRCAEPGTVNLLRLELSELVRWAEDAPAIRLEGLEYACSEDDVVVVTGARLPSLSAERFVLRDGLALIAGWRLDPPVPVSVVKAIVGASANSIVLIDCAGMAETIELNHFVPLTRASVRMTAVREQDE